MINIKIRIKSNLVKFFRVIWRKFLKFFGLVKSDLDIKISKNMMDFTTQERENKCVDFHGRGNCSKPEGEINSIELMSSTISHEEVSDEKKEKMWKMHREMSGKYKKALEQSGGDEDYNFVLDVQYVQEVLRMIKEIKESNNE